MKRQMFEGRKENQIGGAKIFNEDTVAIHEEMKSNSTDMILTSIPFGDHYEYSDNYNDMGHNHGNENFFPNPCEIANSHPSPGWYKWNEESTWLRLLLLTIACRFLPSCV